MIIPYTRSRLLTGLHIHYNRISAKMLIFSKKPHGCGFLKHKSRVLAPRHELHKRREEKRGGIGRINGV